MKLGIIAGDGRLPEVFAQRAKQLGHAVVAVQVVPNEYSNLKKYADAYHEIPVGQWQTIVTTLKQSGVDELYLLGKVQKGLMYSGLQVDDRFRGVLAGLKVRNDDAVVLAFIQDLADEGLKVGSQVDLISHLLVHRGVLTRLAPSKNEWADIRFGFKMAKGIAGLDIGQTVVVKNGAVVAVEAIEGTDETIRRAGSLAGPGCIVTKVAKPGQDLRFDVPTVGKDTIRTMAEAGAKILAVEAEATLIVDQAEVVAEADAAGICIVGTEPAPGGGQPDGHPKNHACCRRSVG